MIKYRPTTFLPLLLSYLLLGVIPSQGAAINNNSSNGYLEISGNTVTYLPGKDSKKDEDLKNVVQKFNENFPSESRKKEIEATIASIRNFPLPDFPLPDFPLPVINIINSYNEEISHLDITKAGNLKILKYLNKYAKKHITTLTCSLFDESEAALLKRLPNVTRLNVKLMENENIKNCVRSLLKLKLNLSTKSIELPESFEDNCPNEFIKLKNQRWKLNPEKNGRKIIPLIRSLKDPTVDEEKIIKRTIEQLIEEGADLNAKDKNGNCSLNIAVKMSNSGIATLLINNGADVNAKDKKGDNPLNIAVRNDRLKMATLLIKNGADANSMDNNGMTFFYKAVLYRYKKMATLLIANINRENENGDTPLHIILRTPPRSSEQIEKIATFLINYGFDINATNNDKNTPLHILFNTSLLSSKKIKKTATFLIKNGADINAINKDKNTPLHILFNTLPPTSHDSRIMGETATFLIKNGADINAINKDKNTPLHILFLTLPPTSHGSRIIELALFLINNGAKTNAINNDWKIPFDLTTEKIKETIAPSIFEGADRDVQDNGDKFLE